MHECLPIPIQSLHTRVTLSVVLPAVRVPGEHLLIPSLCLHADKRRVATVAAWKDLTPGVQCKMHPQAADPVGTITRCKQSWVDEHLFPQIILCCLFGTSKFDGLMQ